MHYLLHPPNTQRTDDRRNPRCYLLHSGAPTKSRSSRLFSFFFSSFLLCFRFPRVDFLAVPRDSDYIHHFSYTKVHRYMLRGKCRSLWQTGHIETFSCQAERRRGRGRPGIGLKRAGTSHPPPKANCGLATIKPGVPPRSVSRTWDQQGKRWAEKGAGREEDSGGVSQVACAPVRRSRMAVGRRVTGGPFFVYKWVALSWGNRLEGKAYPGFKVRRGLDSQLH